MSRSIDVAGVLRGAEGLSGLLGHRDSETMFADARAALLEACEQLDGVAAFLVGYGEEAEIASRGIRKALAHIGHGEAPR